MHAAFTVTGAQYVHGAKLTRVMAH